MVKRILNVGLELARHLANDRHVMIGARFEADGHRWYLYGKSKDPRWGVLVTTFVSRLFLRTHLL